MIEVVREDIKRRKEFQKQELKHGSQFIINATRPEEALTGLLAVAGQYIGLAMSLMKLMGTKPSKKLYNEICKEIEEVAFITVEGIDKLNREVQDEDK